MIQINDDFRLTSDPNCVILQMKHIREKKDGSEEVVWRNEGYYPNYKYALKSMIRRGIMEIDDVQKIVDKLEQLEKDIDNLKGELKI